MMNKNYPTILIISIGALSKTNSNGKTIETLFKDWPQDKLAHLYFSLEKEDFQFCKKAFLLTDYDCLDNLTRIKKKPHGGVVTPDYDFMDKSINYRKVIADYFQKNQLNQKQKISMNISKSMQQRKPIAYLLREILWKDTKWYESRLYQWINSIQPELIFFQGYYLASIYNLVKKIQSKYDIPLILECTDDYTQPHYPESIINHIITRRYVRRFRQLLAKVGCLYAISDKMRIEYKEKYYKGPTLVVSNSIDGNYKRMEYKKKDDFRLIYAGNLELNRWRQIVELGLALEELCKDNKLKIKFDIYSASQLENGILETITNVSIISFHGFVDSYTLKKEVEKSDFLIHVESPDDINKRVTRLSISTKIGEYLASGRCIIAMGPLDVASIEYIKEKQLGRVIESNDRAVIKDSVLELLTNPEYCQKYVNNATYEYNNRYRSEIINKKVYESVKNLVKRI